MQETIIVLCLTVAAAYLGYTFYKKIRHKNSGCCGCSGECCSKSHGSCASASTAEIQAFSRSGGSRSPDAAGAGTEKPV